MEDLRSHTVDAMRREMIKACRELGNPQQVDDVISQLKSIWETNDTGGIPSPEAVEFYISIERQVVRGSRVFASMRADNDEYNKQYPQIVASWRLTKWENVGTVQFERDPTTGMVSLDLIEQLLMEPALTDPYVELLVYASRGVRMSMEQLREAERRTMMDVPIDPDASAFLNPDEVKNSASPSQSAPTQSISTSGLKTEKVGSTARSGKKTRRTASPAKTKPSSGGSTKA